MDPEYHNSHDDSESSNDPLIPDFEKGGPLNQEPRKTAQRRLRLWPYIFHVLLFMSYSLAYLLAFEYQTTDDKLSGSVAYSPANGALRYHKVAYDGALHQASPYRGEPRPELDRAWSDLIKHFNIRLSKDELQMMNRTALELDVHVDHCIDDIRQALMCHPDTSIITLDWKSPEWRTP
ncbi:hypothetical protein PG997_000223 [Apiospora hydei]|uniref:Uncharacterized protein n=1 Tax=Apiospora hydei TaxID=1337664 RepID=A0ABR1XAA0_9PEZI